MKSQIEKIVYDGQKFQSLGNFHSLETAHAEHGQYNNQLTFEEVEQLPKTKPYLHLVEYRDGDHYNDLYFTWNK